MTDVSVVAYRFAPKLVCRCGGEPTVPTCDQVENDAFYGTSIWSVKLICQRCHSDLGSVDLWVLGDGEDDGDDY